MPERDLLYARDSGKTVVQVDLEGRCPKRDVRSPMNVVVVLDGLDDCDRIFSILHSAGFDSRISIEDGMEDLRESVQFLRGKIDRQFT